MFDDIAIEIPKGFSGFFKKKKTKSVGVDIGSSSIKIVELEKRGEEIFLKNYALTKVKNKELIKPGSSKIISKEAGKVVQKIFNDIGINTKSVNVAIPSLASLITTIELPPVSEKEIEQIIQVEAPKYIPVPLVEVVYGWEIIDDKLTGDKNQEDDPKLLKASQRKPIRVVLASIMKNISEEYEKVFREVGYEIDSLEIDTFALKRSMVNRKKRGSCLLADIGDHVTNISIVANGSVVANRSIDVGGSRMLELLSKALGINKERAEKIKNNQGLEIDSEEVKKQVILPLLKNISDEIKSAKESFEESYSELKVESIILSGGFSQTKGLKEFFKKELGGIDIIDGNPWSNLNYPEKIKNNLESLSPYFGVAIGLALRDFLEN